MMKRIVRVTLEVVAETDRDAWEWGDAIARNVVADIRDGSGWFAAAQCLEIEDPASTPQEPAADTLEKG